MNRFCRALLFALPLLVSCSDPEPSVLESPYRQVGDLTVTAWASAIAPDGDLLVGGQGRIYRYKNASKTWVNVPRDGLPDGRVRSLAASGAGDYLAGVEFQTWHVLRAGQSLWEPVARPDPALPIGVATLGADGTLYALSGQGTASRVDRRAVSGATWTLVFGGGGSSAVIEDIKRVYPNGDLLVNGKNLAGKYLLRASGMLEAAFDCSGDAVRRYCEDNPFISAVFAPNGDVVLTYGGLGTRTVYRASASSFPLRPQAIGNLPEGAVQFTGLVALNDGTVIGFGDQPTKSLFRLRPGASQWQDLGERPFDPAYVEVQTNAAGQVFFLGRQCCFAPLPVTQLVR